VRSETEKIIIKKISEEIRKKREELSMSRSSLASEAGLDEKQMRRIEKGESTLPIVTLLRVFYVLKLDIGLLNEYLKDESILH
jgi:transcriptional regulator with XRE-family HTH domain